MGNKGISCMQNRDGKMLKSMERSTNVHKIIDSATNPFKIFNNDNHGSRIGYLRNETRPFFGFYGDNHRHHHRFIRIKDSSRLWLR